MANAKKKAKTMLSSFSIILILIFGLGILSHLLYLFFLILHLQLFLKNLLLQHD